VKLKEILISISCLVFLGYLGLVMVDYYKEGKRQKNSNDLVSISDREVSQKDFLTSSYCISGVKYLYFHKVFAGGFSAEYKNGKPISCDSNEILPHNKKIKIYRHCKNGQIYYWVSIRKGAAVATAVDVNGIAISCESKERIN